ncbi:hypothetical protein EYF80_061807 [Liparis tanakae]|uniref:Uncharacterized protein n=1 Tax=Liparis tanakae TaxID=230148 RepID=A0A4Z2EHT8_9TELE|nr:hypothetical protein EYF80_061807 [Liparis tanakae]
MFASLVSSEERAQSNSLHEHRNTCSNNSHRLLGALSPRRDQFLTSCFCGGPAPFSDVLMGKRHQMKDNERNQMKDNERNQTKDNKRNQTKDNKRNQTKDNKRNQIKDNKRNSKASAFQPEAASTWSLESLPGLPDSSQLSLSAAWHLPVILLQEPWTDG